MSHLWHSEPPSNFLPAEPERWVCRSGTPAPSHQEDSTPNHCEGPFLQPLGLGPGISPSHLSWVLSPNSCPPGLYNCPSVSLSSELPFHRAGQMEKSTHSTWIRSLVDFDGMLAGNLAFHLEIAVTAQFWMVLARGASCPVKRLILRCFPSWGV